MLFIGQRCAHDACSLVDFLPLKVRLLSSLCGERANRMSTFPIPVPILPPAILFDTLPGINAFVSVNATSAYAEPYSANMPNVQHPAVNRSRRGSEYRDEQAYPA
jgi:hypothetical protein